MSIPSVHEKSLLSAGMRALAVAKGKPYSHLPPGSTLAAIVRHGGLYTLLDSDLMTSRIAGFAATPREAAGTAESTAKPPTPQPSTPQMVQKLRSTAANFFYRLVDQPGYNVHSELMVYITEPGTENGVTYDLDLEPSPHIPAAFTFVGQFIDHDLTFNGINLTMDEHDAVVADNASPIIDLDSVYGPRSRAGEFEKIYNPDGTFQLNELPAAKGVYYDVNRDSDPTTGLDLAYIFDPRNDENQLILQIHILIERLHNKVLGDPRFKPELAGLTGTSQIVDRVRQEVVAIWQSFILHDYMPAIIRAGTLEHVRDEIHKKAPDVDHIEQQYGDLRHKPYRDLVTGKNVVRLPHEFAIGFRFGHSQLRPFYKLNAGNPVLLFRNAGRTDETFGGLTIKGDDDLRGGRALVPGHAIDWSVFYPKVPTPETMSMLIDRKVTARVFNLPESAIPDDIKYVANLPHRNLIRGSQIGVVSGEELARFYGITPLTPDEVLGDDKGRAAVDELFRLDHDAGVGSGDFKTPLWYYVLKEAEVHSKGARLGKVGSRLVAEVLAGACYYGDEFRFDDSWRSKVINTTASTNTITLHDIIDYVQS